MSLVSGACGKLMKLQVFDDRVSAGTEAGKFAKRRLIELLDNNRTVNIVVATGASQFDTLAEFTSGDEIDWSRVHAFHLDEYVGLSRSHPASFCGYLEQRFASKVDLASMLYLDGTADPEEMCRSASEAVSKLDIGLGLIGIGENGHLAFNDPPANFETKAAYHIVNLDQACRAQQVGEGWFNSLNEVPQRAISMTVYQIMKIQSLVCTVPDARKAEALKNSVQGPITPDVPASILQLHTDVTVFCDRAAVSKIDSIS
jgi:glucosamine-6-phosphate deaminase